MKLWMLLLSVVLAISVCGSGTSRSAVLPSPIKLDTREAHDLLTPLTFDAERYAVLKEARGNVTLRDFPISRTVSADLLLERFEVLPSNAAVVIGSELGDIPTERPDVVLLRGTIDGLAKSSVYLGLSPWGCNGWLMIEDDMYFLSAGSRTNNKSLHIYRVKDMPGYWFQSDWFCDADSLLPRGLSDQTNDVVIADDCGGKLCSIAVETDWEFTGSLFGGNTNASGAYVTTLFGAVDFIYRRDFGVAVNVPYMRLWSNSNDPWNQNNTSNQLNQFRTYWTQNMQQIYRNIAHFLSGRALGGGVAWLGVLCDYGYGYGLSANLAGSFPPGLEPGPNNWDPFVVTHEIGHNFGAPHTHEMFPPVDTCGLGCNDPPFVGTIMSYCHICPGGMSNIHLEFHPRTIEVVQNYLRGISCLSSAVLTCNVALQEYQGTAPLMGYVEFRKPGTGELESLRSVVYQNGTFGLNTSMLCEHDFSVKFPTFLRKTIPSVMILPPETILNFAMLNGDANNDNVVDIRDINIVLSRFGLTGQGDVNYNGVVDVADLSVMLINFGLVGDT
ncbi:MAG: hypothetical protein HRF45_12565 [Fimbriimonadia bacterium]|jgi:hypothetical protein